ncbi:MAG: efflux RND transporter periplasmic adaptor subunit, partial [Planctomycetaceae bacterium]|nr:efflux RND transporter periplasmic adaptor subunit [Planctomycetaceae bacterium]
MIDLSDLRIRPEMTLRLTLRWWVLGGVCAVLLAPTVGLAASNGTEGFLEPYRTIDVAASEPGILDQIHVQEGSVVTAGTVVAELNNSVLEAALQVAEETSHSRGKLESAQAELKLAEKLLEKLQELHTRKIPLATPQEIERASAERDVAAARLLAVEEELQVRALEALRIEREIELRRLRSPIDGVVTKQFRDVGEYVSPADPTVVTIVQLDPLTAVFAAPQNVVSRLRADARVTIRIGDAGQNVEGVVEFVSPLIDPRSGTG